MGSSRKKSKTIWTRICSSWDRAVTVRREEPEVRRGAIRRWTARQAGARRSRKARSGQYWSPAGLLLARVQMLMGEQETALETARKVIEQDPQESYRLEYALMLMQAGREEEGRKELTALTSAEGAGAVAERALADIDFQLGNRDSAAQRCSNLVTTGRFVY